MLGNLEGQILSAHARRAVAFANDLPTASRFDPRLPGFSMPGRNGVTASQSSMPLPESDDDIAFATLPELGAWIRTGELSSRRLTQIYLDRISRFDPLLECFATVTGELALAEADAMDALTRAGVNLGPLHGLPYGLKDLFDTKGIVTGWGAEPYRDRVPDRDAAVVTRLRTAGAILIGKTSVGALAYGDIWYGGRTRNPWNVDEGSSGSSAGSASATGAGLCAFAIGTETLGSITSPADRCGATGLRPTFGRVSRSGVMALCWSLDKVGPICRGAEDCVLVLAAINGGDAADRFSIDAPFHFDAAGAIDGLRIGWLPRAFEDGADDVDRAALEAVRSLNLPLVEAHLEDLPYASLLNILYAEAAASFEELTLSDRDDLLAWQDDAAWPNSFRKARFMSAVDHVQLDRLRYRAMLAMQRMFEDIDVLIGPLGSGPMMITSNFTGHPCLHIRAGFADLPNRSGGALRNGKLMLGQTAGGQKRRVPKGISLWGRLFEEGRLVNLGMALEAKLGVAKQRPILQA